MAIIDFKATKCRHCYKCVRNCEVKAIMVKDGRAEIMPDNCILCGRCLQICPQSAKTLISDLGLVKGMPVSYTHLSWTWISKRGILTGCIPGSPRRA